MKMILIAVVGVLLLGGAGAGAYFYFMKPAEAASGEIEKAGEKAHDEAKKEGGDHGGGGGGHGEGGGVEFVKLDPLILPIIGGDGVTQVVSLVVAIEVSSAEDKDTVTKLVPRLQDAFIQQMYGELGNQASIKGGVIQVAVIKKRLNEITTKVLGSDIAKDVLLQVVQQRPA